MQKINNEQAYNCLNPWLVCFASIVYADASNYYWLEPKDCRSKHQNKQHYIELRYPDKKVKYYGLYKNLMIQTKDSICRLEVIL